jgi:hypothetical protein
MGCYQKAMERKKRKRERGPGKMNAAIKDAVERAFTRKNVDGEYLETLADTHPAVFCALVAKCIPQAVAVDVHHHAVNLGTEMQRAADNLARLNKQPDTPAMIDVTPDTPDNVSPVTVSGSADDV